MPAPTSTDAYPQQIEAMQKALEAENGVRLKFNDRAQAVSFRRMCYKARDVWFRRTGGDNSFSALSITLTEAESGFTLIISKPPKIDMEVF